MRCFPLDASSDNNRKHSCLTLTCLKGCLEFPAGHGSGALPSGAFHTLCLSLAVPLSFQTRYGFTFLFLLSCFTRAALSPPLAILAVGLEVLLSPSDVNCSDVLCWVALQLGAPQNCSLLLSPCLHSAFLSLSLLTTPFIIGPAHKQG